MAEPTSLNWADQLPRKPRCQEPHSVWVICGIPEDMHEETFAWAKGTRHWHAFRAPAETTLQQDQEKKTDDE